MHSVACESDKDVRGEVNWRTSAANRASRKRKKYLHHKEALEWETKVICLFAQLCNWQFFFVIVKKFLSGRERSRIKGPRREIKGADLRWGQRVSSASQNLEWAAFLNGTQLSQFFHLRSSRLTSPAEQPAQHDFLRSFLISRVNIALAHESPIILNQCCSALSKKIWIYKFMKTAHVRSHRSII